MLILQVADPFVNFVNEIIHTYGDGRYTIASSTKLPRIYQRWA